MERQVDELMKSAIDTHVHFKPESVTDYRAKHNVYDIVTSARDMGMRALVLKNVTFPSVGIAHLMSTLVDGIKVYGSIVLNKSVGGINPIAVERAIVHGEEIPGEFCKVVWMPTFSSTTDVAYYGKSKAEEVPILREGRLIPEVKDILKMIAENKLILATGHLNVEECSVLINEALDLGVTKIVLTHPHNVVPYIGIARQLEFAAKGVMIEYCNVMCTQYYKNKYKFIITPSRIAMDIKDVGAENAIIATDYGLDPGTNPVPAEGMRTFIEDLLKNGITPEEIKTMQNNAAKLLGLD